MKMKPESVLKLINCRWFKEGQKARAEGQDASACPYGGGSPKALLWEVGFECEPEQKPESEREADPLDEDEMVI